MNLFRSKRYELPNHADRGARTCTFCSVRSLLAPLMKGNLLSRNLFTTVWLSKSAFSKPGSKEIVSFSVPVFCINKSESCARSCI